MEKYQMFLIGILKSFGIVWLLTIINLQIMLQTADSQIFFFFFFCEKLQVCVVFTVWHIHSNVYNVFIVLHIDQQLVTYQYSTSCQPVWLSQGNPL